MMLYLARHGEANPTTFDVEKKLSIKGTHDVNLTAASIGRMKAPVDRIWHSGKARAVQTAAILADHLQYEKRLEQTDGLAPNDDPAVWAERLETMREDVMLVGHLPHLSRLASMLLCGNPDRSIIDFRPAGIACLKRAEGRWTIAWVITPDILA
jgi:phosphohistidine phosphatase